MRVAVFHNLPSGGAKRAMVEMIRQLRLAGDIVDVFAPSTADEEIFPSSAVANSVTIAEAQGLSRGRTPGFGRQLRSAEDVQRRLAVMIDAGKYDVAFVHHCRFVQSPWVLSQLRVPSVYYCQEPYRIAYEARLQPRAVTRVRLWAPAIGIARIDRRNVAHANAVLANSYYSRESILRAYGVDAHVVPLGVDGARFEAAVASERQHFVLSVGAITPFKGHRLTIEAIGRIQGDRRPRLVIIGDRQAGGEVDLLHSKASELGVELDIRTRVGEDELVDCYRHAAIVVCAAELEPFGLTVLEAGATGAAVVAVREAGYRETVVNGTTGLLVEDRDPRTLSGVIELLVRDTQLRGRLGAAAAEYVRREWSWGRTGTLLREQLVSASNRQ